MAYDGWALNCNGAWWMDGDEEWKVCLVTLMGKVAAGVVGCWTGHATHALLARSLGDSVCAGLQGGLLCHLTWTPITANPNELVPSMIHLFLFLK